MFLFTMWRRGIYVDMLAPRSIAVTVVLITAVTQEPSECQLFLVQAYYWHLQSIETVWLMCSMQTTHNPHSLLLRTVFGWGGWPICEYCKSLAIVGRKTEQQLYIGGSFVSSISMCRLCN